MSPFLHRADKNAWTRIDKACHPEKYKAWQERARRKRLMASAIKRNEREHLADLAIVPSVMAHVRKLILLRDGLRECVKCDTVKPLAEMSKGARNTRCRACVNEYARAYMHAHPEVRRRSLQTQMHKRHVRIRTRIRDRIGRAIRRAGCGQTLTGSNLRYLGCTAHEACDHLESLFKDGMTWENYGRGGWEIDHVIPLAMFNLQDEDDRKRAFHYTNIQPLWAEENRKKNRHWVG
jgi:hypothetical protein